MGRSVITGWFKIGIEVEINSIREYLESAERFLESEIKKIEEEFLKEKKIAPKEKHWEINEYYSDVYYELTEVFPRILRNSLFVLSYSMIENFLNNFCDSAKRHYGLKLTLSDLKGRGVERARAYLKKVAEIDFSDGKEWVEIKHYNQVRNFIVHNNGELDDSGDAKEVEKYIKAKSDLLDLKKDIIGKKVVKKTIVIKRDFCKEVLKTARDFLFQFDDAISAWAKRKKNAGEHAKETTGG